jgi:TusA-related sulfurtransferase
VTPVPSSPLPGGPSGEASLDLRGTPCPLNFIRSKLALEKLAAGAWLLIDLDAGEPEQMVASGLREAGHRVELEPLEPGAVRLRIRRNG